MMKLPIRPVAFLTPWCAVSSLLLLGVGCQISTGAKISDAETPRASAAPEAVASDTSPESSPTGEEISPTLEISEPTPPPPPVEPLPALATRLARTGDVARAATMLEELLETDGKDQEARLTLAEILDHHGETEEAVAICQAGLKGEARDLPLLQFVAEVRDRQVQDGPYAQRLDGNVHFRTFRNRPAADAMRRKHVALAADAHQAILGLGPDPRTALRLGNYQGRLRQYAKASRILTEVSKALPEEPEAWTRLARVRLARGNTRGASLAASRALALDPRSATSHGVMATVLSMQGKEAAAERSQRKARYYRWMGPFTRVPFEEEQFRTVEAIALPPQGKRAFSRWMKKRGRTIAWLMAEDTPFSLEALANLAWRHEAHEGWEPEVFRVLGKRKAVDLLTGVLDESRHLCIRRGAGWALAALGDLRAYGPLVKKLPEDTRLPMYTDIAGALALLGNPEAVPHLIAALSPDLPLLTEPGPGLSEALVGIAAARRRAALALSAFDAPEPRAALKTCTGNEGLAVFCHASLYALDGEEADFSAVTAAFGDPGTEEQAGILELLRLLMSTGRPEARALAGDLRARLQSAKPTEPATAPQ